MSTTTERTGARTPVRALAVAVVLLLAAALTAVASHSEASTKLAIGRSVPDPTTTTEAPTTSTEPSTTVAPTTSSEPTTPRPPASTAPRATAPRPTAAPKPKPPPPPPAPVSGITAAFLYNWYPDSFSTPGTKYHPIGAPYSSNDPNLVRRQIDQMRYAGMQAAIASWWGPASSTSDHAIKSIDTAVGADLQAAHGTPFQWALYFESGSPALPDRSVGGLRNAMQYIKDHYANDPNYLHIGGRPVIFVWPNAGDGCNMVQSWHDANSIGFYIVQKRFVGWQSCTGLSDSWHEYSPNGYSAVLKPYSYSVSPGFNRYDSQGPFLARDPGQFDKAVAAMAAAPVQWKLVTTFNEWGEGTAVEPASEWGNTYLDILHNHLGSR